MLPVGVDFNTARCGRVLKENDDFEDPHFKKIPKNNPWAVSRKNYTSVKLAF